MDNDHFVGRSPLLLSRRDSAVLVVDLQEKLLKAMSNLDSVIWNIGRILDSAKIVGVPTYATEQYPQGLGHTLPCIAQRTEVLGDKVAFSCCGCVALLPKLKETNSRSIVVVGIETHVCVQQTVFDLLSEAFEVHIVVDALAARHAIDHETAIRRMESAGVTVTTTEAVMFEWCEVAGTAEFKEVSALVRQAPPGS